MAWHTTPVLTEMKEQVGCPNPAGLNVVSRVFGATGVGTDWPEELEELWWFSKREREARSLRWVGCRLAGLAKPSKGAEEFV